MLQMLLSGQMTSQVTSVHVNKYICIEECRLCTATPGICSNFPLKHIVNFIVTICCSNCLVKIACVIQGNYIKICIHSIYLWKEHTFLHILNAFASFFLICIFREKCHILQFNYKHSNYNVYFSVVFGILFKNTCNWEIVPTAHQWKLFILFICPSAVGLG